MSKKKHGKPNVAGTQGQNVNKQVIADNTEGSHELKEETLRWIFSIVGALLVYSVAAFILLRVYHPDVDALIKQGNQMVFAGGVRPEPLEALLFRAGIFIVIPGILGFYALFSKRKLIKNLTTTSSFLFISTLSVVTIVCFICYDFLASNPFASGGPEQPQNNRDLVGKTNFDFFFEGLFLGNNLLFYTFVLVPAIVSIFYLGIRKYNWQNSNLFKWVSSGIGYMVTGGILLAIILMNVFYFPYSFENKYDFNAVYYSMTQVYAGVPMLVDGFSNTYGLYPHFLNIIFSMIGLSIFKFSLVLALLLAVAFIFNFYVLRKLVSNNVILFLGYLTVIFFPYLDFKFLTPFDCSFATFPIRYIIPSTLVFLATLYFYKRSLKIYWLTFILMAFSVLWNPEIGLVTYLSWIAVITFNDFFTTEGKIAIKRILGHWLTATGTIIVVFLAYKLIVWGIYGTSADFEFLFSFIIQFSKIGFGLLPMALVHPWNLIAITIILGFTYSGAKWYKKQIAPKTAVVFLISVIALGFLTYFQGRSHNWPFAASSGFALILLTILGDEFWENIKKTNLLPLHFLFVVFLFAISFSFFEIITNTSKINELVYQEDDNVNQVKVQQQIENNTNFVLRNSHEKEKIYLFTSTQYQSLYFDGTKRRSAFNPGLGDMVLNNDLVKLENKILDSSFCVFIEPSLCAYQYMERPLAAIAASYEIMDSNKSMKLLHKRKTKTPATAFFNRTPTDIIYRKYSDDTTGLKLRVNDALGLQSVNFSTTFSVQMLFHPAAQMYQFPTLVGNMNDSSGFIIANIPNSSNYVFLINNGNQFGASIPNDQWDYLVMNIYPDHREVYVNGNLVDNSQLREPMRKSPLKLYIGNIGYMRYFVGPISEVAINNTVVDKDKVAQTWGKISQEVNKTAAK